MKKYVALLLAVIACGSCLAQDDPVIMTINGVNVLRSEFEYSFNKNNSEGVIDKKSIEEYVDLFINYKLKVAAALDAHLDTLTSYIKEFRTYRDQQILPTFVTEADMEQEAQFVYNQTKENIGPQGFLSLSHILIYLPQKATVEEQAKAKEKADSVYNAIREGANFEEMAKQHSGDRGSAARGGKLGWVQKGQTVKEFEDAAFKLEIGEMSKPVLSPFGYHIILLNEKKQLEPYEELKEQVMKFIEARNAREIIANRKLDAMIASDSTLTKEGIMDEKAKEMAIGSMEMKYLFQEYHDGLLLYEISNQKVWSAAEKDTIGQEHYFNANKKKYAWDEPRFKGIVYHTRNKSDLKAVKKVLKKLPFSEWATVLKNTFNNDSIFRLRADKGVFKKGDNAFADKLVFKVKDSDPKALQDYPYNSFFGKMLKKGPEDFTDVISLVISDYQEQLEKEWVKDLRQKYSFSVNKDVLKTVNKH